MRILHLTLKKKWFDLIANGEKTSEYREYKKHWKDRLLDHRGQIKQFDEIHARNGYGEGRPFMRIEWRGTEIKQRSYFKPINGENLDGCSHWFRIILGEILEVRRPEGK